MGNVWFCSDLHFGHKNIQKYRHEVSSETENRLKIIHDWKRLVTKRDVVYVLGDALFTMDCVNDLLELNGRKFLIRGNHDLLDTSVYLKIFKDVYGLLKYKEFWLSHAPIHPEELRGKINLHGHTHYFSLDDKRYFNCCVENVLLHTGFCLISLDQIRSIVHK